MVVIEILRELREFDNQLPVILLTAYGTMNSAVEAMHLGATDYILKPVEPEVLINLTETILVEKQKEKRKKEIQEQITSLQNELANLEKELLPTTPPPSPKNDSSRYISRGPFIIDLQTRKVENRNGALDLPPATFEYFLVLFRHAPEIVKYQTLENEAQGYPVEFTEARELSRWHIHVIRQIIEIDPRNPKYLLNVRGIGYQLNID